MVFPSLGWLGSLGLGKGFNLRSFPAQICTGKVESSHGVARLVFFSSRGIRRSRLGHWKWMLGGPMAEGGGNHGGAEVAAAGG
ncbi:hypothetical protein CDL15_Pgr004860 [Punica granatum]|uniref:Uncharacterized protein n=1 Tax=Punica granatum TaxID=22663 RepID=A0A218W7C1_PUNGR|nr:hypothetical protein CDL15_Pgr004860 [Punica granatum]